MMGESETPILELLKSVQNGVWVVYAKPPGPNAPLTIKMLCAQAAAEIERLQGLLDSNFGSGWEDFDRAKFSVLRATIERQRTALTLAVPALELGVDALEDRATHYHMAMKGYRPDLHKMHDDAFQQAKDALSAVREALGPAVNQENPK